ncbi:MAG: 50S ribosomal protein L29 [Candidatus Aenigmatarchaeota archaeon]
MRKKEMRKMESRELDRKIAELRLELAKQKASIKIGATVSSPGRIRQLRKTIARGLTIKKEKSIRNETKEVKKKE